MANKFGIPDKELEKAKLRDKNCVYCRKAIVHPSESSDRRDWATIEHLDFDGPFYWKDGLNTENIVMCCGSCNSSRGAKTLHEWFDTTYCLSTET